MNKEETIQSAMQIILHAGDARKYCMDALKAIEASDFNQAQQQMKLANTEIIKAHHIQTDAITAEVSGEAGEYSVLFAHAQDTLMTIYSEINIVKRMIKIFNIYDHRIEALELLMKEKKEEKEVI